jgi:hypothetical protein
MSHLEHARRPGNIGRDSANLKGFDMKVSTSILAACAASLLTSISFAADSGERTSMPSSCSERDANCIIQDGPPRRRTGEAPPTTTAPSAPSAADSRGSGAKPGTTRPGETGSSR